MPVYTSGSDCSEFSEGARVLTLILASRMPPAMPASAIVSGLYSIGKFRSGAASVSSNLINAGNYRNYRPRERPRRPNSSI